MTKKLKTRYVILSLISILLWFGMCGFLVTYGLINATQSSFAKQLVDLFLPLSAGYVISIIAVIFIHEKVRNTVWIANVLLSSIFFSNTVVYVVISLYALDEFIILPLAKHFKNRYRINKEIDLRP